MASGLIDAAHAAQEPPQLFYLNVINSQPTCRLAVKYVPFSGLIEEM
jgi:hypothetical protein